MKGKKPFYALWEIFSFSDYSRTILLLVLFLTSFLIYKGKLSDTSFVAVAPIIISHLIIEHRKNNVASDAPETSASPIADVGVSPPQTPILPDRGKL